MNISDTLFDWPTTPVSHGSGAHISPEFASRVPSIIDSVGIKVSFEAQGYKHFDFRLRFAREAGIRCWSTSPSPSSRFLLSTIGRIFSVKSPGRSFLRPLNLYLN